MIEITYFQLFLFITIIWIITRCFIAIKSKTFSVKRECLQLLVYVCIVVICRGRVYSTYRNDSALLPRKTYGC